MPKNYYDFELELNEKQKKAEEEALKDLQTIPQYKDAYGQPMQSGSASLNRGPAPEQRTDFTQSTIQSILPKPDYSAMMSKEDPKAQTISVIPGFDRSGIRKASYNPDDNTAGISQRETNAPPTPRRNTALDVVFPSDRLSPEDQARFNAGSGMRLGWRPGMERGATGSGMIIDEQPQETKQNAPQEEKKTDWSRFRALLGSSLAGFGAGMQGRDVSQAFQSAYSPYEQKQQEKSAAEQRRSQAQAILARQTKGTPVSQDYAAMTYDLFPGVFQGLPRERVINGFSQEYLEKMLPEAMRMKIAQAQAASRKNASQPGQAGTGAAGKILAGSDAEKLSDLKTSLGMLSDLQNSAVNLSDSMTSWWKGPIRSLNPADVEAKSFQQMIAATKQIIGKGLEGGVLRAEDEKKYDKILPKIGDSQEILANKFSQLRNMLSQKQKNMLETYQQAGYDVSKMTESPIQAAPAQTAPTVSNEDRKAAIVFLRSKGIDDPNDDEIERAAAMMRSIQFGKWNGGTGVQRNINTGNGRD